jgi:hypothetical protein
MLVPTIVITDVDTSAIRLWRETNHFEIDSQNRILIWLRSMRSGSSIPKISVVDSNSSVKVESVLDVHSVLWWGDVESDSESEDDYIE